LTKPSEETGLKETRLEETRLHRALVLSNQLQSLPAALVALSFVGNSVLVFFFWLGSSNTTTALLAALGVLVASLINWWLLRRLPKQGRSFGPDQPSALALGAALALITDLLGLFGASVGLVLLVVALISALAVYATWIEPFRVTLTRQRFAASATASAWRGANDGEGACLRVLHLSDLHIERITARERRLNALIESLQPDLIVFTGDFVNLSYSSDAQAKQDIRAILGAWRAPLGVYCVPGTPIVEPMTRVVEFVERLDNLTLLANRWVTVETRCGVLHILGLVTTHDLKTDRAALNRMTQSAPADGLKLLLAHSPDIAPEAAEFACRWSARWHRRVVWASASSWGATR
jgi:predicted MPP superfamily phosphohydrolase